MKTLLHSCCGPCTIYPLSVLLSRGHDVTAYFHNPNIHPFKEFKRRLDTLKEYSKNEGFNLVADSKYGLKEYLREVVFHEQERCDICYSIRLNHTAEYAKNNDFEAFTTTLLYSRYQNHDSIIKICETLARDKGLSFIYEDFREGWQEGIDISKEKEMYRQPYCGCIYSEQERYDKSLKKNK